MKKSIIIIIAALMAMPVAVSAAEYVEVSALTDKKPAKKKGEIKSVVFSVHLHCENCMKKVMENVSFEKGVKDLKVSLEEQTVSIKFDASKTNEQTLAAAIEKLGYPVSGIVEPGQEPHVHNHDHKH